MAAKTGPVLASQRKGLGSIPQNYVTAVRYNEAQEQDFLQRRLKLSPADHAASHVSQVDTLQPHFLFISGA